LAVTHIVHDCPAWVKFAVRSPGGVPIPIL
jgi:hypothetical protein